MIALFFESSSEISFSTAFFLNFLFVIFELEAFDVRFPEICYSEILLFELFIFTFIPCLKSTIHLLCLSTINLFEESAAIFDLFFNSLTYWLICSLVISPEAIFYDRGVWSSLLSSSPELMKTLISESIFLSPFFLHNYGCETLFDKFLISAESTF